MLIPYRNHTFTMPPLIHKMDTWTDALFIIHDLKRAISFLTDNQALTAQLSGGGAVWSLCIAIISRCRAQILFLAWAASASASALSFSSSLLISAI